MTRQEIELHDLRVIRSEHRRALLAAYRASMVKSEAAPWWAWMLLGASLAMSIMLILAVVAT